MAVPVKATETLKEGFLCGNPSAAPFKDLDDFYGRGQLAHLEEFFVWEQENLLTKVLVPVKEPDYARASAEDGFRAVELLPDPDLIMKLFLVDHAHPMGPWIQQSRGTVVMGESTEDGVVILYRPTSSGLATTLLYEWCNILRIYNSKFAELFALTQTLEDFIDLRTEAKVEDPRVAWNLLGSLLIREPEETVFALCVRFPLKAAAFGRALVRSLLDISEFRRTESFQHFLDRARTIDFSASKVGLDALKKLPGDDSSIKKLIEFLSAQELLKSLGD